MTARQKKSTVTARVSRRVHSRGESVVLAVARRWRRARDLGQPVQQRLHALLSPRDWDVLAPVFDSFMTLCEAALRRPLRTGDGRRASADERMLLGLLDGTLKRGACVDVPLGEARILDGAIGSTRAMIAITMGQRGPSGR